MNTDKIYAEAIANEYSAKETSKVKALRRLDMKAKSPANIFGYSFGLIMALVLGVGMCLCTGVIGSGNRYSFVAGIIIGIIGIAGVSINYPIYKKMLEIGKQKYAADIIMLAKEISEAEE